jgi:hypothetical protein
VLVALIRQLLIFILKYLSGILLSVDDVLQIGLRCFQLGYPASRSAKVQEFMLGYCQGTHNKYSTSWWRHTFVLLAQQLVLANQVIALRLHLLYLVMVLGEGSIQFGLQHGGVLLGFVEFLL